MKEKLFVQEDILIDATPVQIWKVLTDPQETKKYMYGCEAVSRWKVGAPLLWKCVFNGEEIIAVKGAVADVLKNKFLAYTSIDPNADIEDIPENYTTITYTLTQEEEQTRLTVTQGDFAKVANGDQRYEHTSGKDGWAAILEKIKAVVERAYANAVQ